MVSKVNDSVWGLFPIFTVRKRSCRKVMFLHLSVIVSTGGGVCQCTPRVDNPLGRQPPQADNPHGQTPPGSHPPPRQTPTSPGRHPPPRQTPPGRHPLGRHPPPQQTATAVDGTHPTGMHSCYFDGFTPDLIVINVTSTLTDIFSPLGGHILAPKYSHLNNYVFPFTIEEESQLAAVGYQEHVGLGRRLASRVQQLLGGASEAELRLIASTRNRSIDSAKGFRQVM